MRFQRAGFGWTKNGISTYKGKHGTHAACAQQTGEDPQTEPVHREDTDEEGDLVDNTVGTCGTQMKRFGVPSTRTS